jgi:hypothetical protein
MRNLALAVATILVVAIASPAFAQPFADVPTDHWAFDAIAELAAKGIIEGFPDGTFKGDRGVSRYEVAIIVARILARIEAIKIPAPAAPAPAPQVTRTDVQTIQRLVNEFRAELAALGVRVTAVEEELTALKAKTTNVSVKGDTRFRYNVFSGGGNPSIRYRNRLTFTGKSTPDVSATVRASFGGGGGGLLPCMVPPCSGAGQRPFRFDFDLASPAVMQTVNFDLAYIDLNNKFGLNWRLGQFGYTLGAGVGWSGYGLMFDPSNADVFSPVGVADGLKAAGSFSGFNYELASFRESPALDIFTGRIETAGLMPGWTVGAAALWQRRNATQAMPTAAASLSGTTGTSAGAAQTADTGFQVDLTGSIFPGLTLAGAYSSFSPDASAGASNTAYAAWVVWDLSSMGMAGLSPTLTAWYKNYGNTTAGGGIPFHAGASTETSTDAALDWNFSGYGAALDLKFSPTLAGSFEYESGNQKVGNATVTEYYASLDYTLAANTTLSFRYFNTILGAAQTLNFYRVQMTYSY